MIPLFTTSQIRELDRYAIQELGIQGPMLMENASLGVIEAMHAKLDIDSSRINFGIICGKGNNGGDGYAVARHLSNLGHNVKIISLGSEKDMSEDCKINFTILKKLSSKRKNISIKKFSTFRDLKFLSNTQIILDAILGTGVTGDLRSPLTDIIKYINSLDVIRVAIDIPTGLNSDTGYGSTIFDADFTITLGDYKRGLFFGRGSEYSGDVVLKEIGIGRDYLQKYPVQDYLIEPEDVFYSLPVKQKSINKYSAGKVFVIAGSGKYPGAAVLTSQSALRSGAGAVILAFPESSRKLIQKNLTEVVFENYQSVTNALTQDAVKGFKEKIKWADVVAIGPGLDRDAETVEAVKEFLKIRKNTNVVFDADAIFSLGKGAYKKYNLKNIVFTPHIAEFSYMIGISVEKIMQDILTYGKGFAIQTESYLVLKGSPSIIFTPSGEALINTTGNPGMAKFGTGDVLTGMIASFISQSKDIEAGILSGVYLHSLAADLLIEKQTEYSINAGDIIKNIPNAINFIRKSFDQIS
ncbi:MAG: NAD(P)H-hydrate dehydratase [Ignavibacteriaceae bacterium]